MTQGYRDMTLMEFVNTLPREHPARAEYKQLLDHAPKDLVPPDATNPYHITPVEQGVDAHMKMMAKRCHMNERERRVAGLYFKAGFLYAVEWIREKSASMDEVEPQLTGIEWANLLEDIE